MLKRCAECECGIEKLLEYFSKMSSQKDGKHCWCKECCKIKRRQNYLNNKDIENENTKKYYQIHKDLLKTNAKEYHKKWYSIDKNREKAKKKSLQWCLENPERRKEIVRHYGENNKSKKALYTKNRKKNDIKFRLRCVVSKAIWYYLKQNNGSKNDSSVWEHLPYTSQQLKEHLEKQFDKNMNWENYGSCWWIDHIYPQSKLLYDTMEHPNFIECWKWTTYAL